MCTFVKIEVQLLASMLLQSVPFNHNFRLIFSRYNKISLKIKEVGEEILLDCTSSCKCKNTPLINCWLMFQSMIAAHNLKMEKQEKMFHKFIIEQLKLI